MDNKPAAEAAVLAKLALAADAQGRPGIEGLKLPKNVLGALPKKGVVQPVCFFETLLEALALAHDRFVAAGLMTRHSSGLRLTKYILHPETVTWVYLKDQKVQATLSLVQDNQELGLPAFESFPLAAQELRRKYAKVVQLTLLASAGHCSGLLNSSLFELYKEAFVYCKERQIDAIISVIYLRHAWFYSKMLHFEPFDVKPSRLGGHKNPLLLAECALKSLLTGPPEKLSLFFKRFILEDKKSDSVCSDRFRLNHESVKLLLKLYPEMVEGFSSKEKEFFENIYGTNLF